MCASASYYVNMIVCLGGEPPNTLTHVSLRDMTFVRSDMRMH